LGGWVHEKRLPEMQRNLLEQALMMYRLRYICVSFRSVYYMRLTGYGFADLSYWTNTIIKHVLWLAFEDSPTNHMAVQAGNDS